MAALFDFLKKKDATEKAREGKKTPAKRKQPKTEKAVKRDEKKEPAVQEPKKEVAKMTSVKQKKTHGFSYDIVKEPHISEKGSILSEKNQYIFRTIDGANKTEIKKAIEGIYGVDVLSVNIVKIPAKKRRLGRTQGYRKGYTKAFIKIKEGQKIEII